ncbi:hypothetical protein QUA42_24305 [Microcoleus sp. Pol11C2]|uniref:hypothetical protein n=1 Tax=Microcoleus sp. Pol11C2 TaxID=3055389 RepID=UPI002FD0E763
MLPELKEIASNLGIIPDGNKTRRETWVTALIGQPFPIFQTIEPIAHCDNQPIENSPGVDRPQALEPIAQTEIQTQNPIENSPGVDRNAAASPVEFPDLEAALTEIARLRDQNDKLLELARSQSDTIRRAKDISPVDKPSFKRVSALAGEALLDISKKIGGGWLLSLGPLKRGFKKLREIWELLVSGDWLLSDIFPEPPPPAAPKPLFPPIFSRFGAIPFCDDELIDSYALGFAGAGSSGRSPPSGGDAML